MPVFLEGEYNYWISALSIAVAFLASLASVNIFSRLIFIRGRHKIFWLVAGAIVMGIGIWSFHFLALLGFNLPIESSISVTYTLLAIVFSILITYFFFYMLISDKNYPGKNILAILLLTTNLVVVHYMSVESIEMAASVVYHKDLMFYAILISFLADLMIVRLLISTQTRPGGMWKKVMTSIGIMIAIIVAHYFLMEANSYYIEKADFYINNSINIFSLI